MFVLVNHIRNRLALVTQLSKKFSKKIMKVTNVYSKEQGRVMRGQNKVGKIKETQGTA